MKIIALKKQFFPNFLKMNAASHTQEKTEWTIKQQRNAGLRHDF